MLYVEVALQSSLHLHVGQIIDFEQLWHLEDGVPVQPHDIVVLELREGELHLGL